MYIAPRKHELIVPQIMPVLPVILLLFSLLIGKSHQLPCDVAKPNPNIQTLQVHPEGNTTGDILFSFVLPPGSLAGLFVLRPQNGILELTNENNNYSILITQDLDAENMTRFDFNLLCNDARQTPLFYRFTLQIDDINDNSPVFVKNLTANLFENTEIGRVVYTLRGSATDADKDTNSIIYSIPDVLLTSSSSFFINGSNVDGEVRLNTQLDYEEGPRQYLLTVIASDSDYNATSTLTVNILDVDDNNPKFNQTGGYDVTFPENTSTIPSFSVSAYDPDTGVMPVKIMYRISQGEQVGGRHLFTINNMTGKLSVTEHLDRETVPSYFLLIQAYQEDKPELRVVTTILNVTVADINDNAPIIDFNSYQVDVLENLDSGFPVLQVSAVDLDQGKNAVFGFFLLNQTGNAFKVNQSTGEISVDNSSLLDRERTSNISFVVFARELSTTEQFESFHSPVLIWLIDQNDNSPDFVNSSYEFWIHESSESVAIGSVSARDGDVGINGQVKYNLEFPQTANKIRINESTGDITLPKDLLPGAYSGIVRATDQGDDTRLRRFSTVTVIIHVIDVNNNPPHFMPGGSPVTVREGVTDQTLAYLRAQDDDTDDMLSCSIVSGDTTNSFNTSYSTSFQSCVLEVVGVLDRETVPDYNLTINVTDGSYSDSKKISVNIIDMNDNHPSFNQSLFEFHVDEGNYTALHIGQIRAFDNDEDSNMEIRYRLLYSSSEFSVNSTSGNLFLTGSLDAEIMQTVEFELAAEDLGEPSLSNTTTVRIHIRDINDNAPYFPNLEPGPLLMYLKENSAPKVLYEVKAVDVDFSAENKRINYRMSSGNISIFNVDLNGNVSTLQPLDLETQPNYTITVEAYNDVKYTNHLRNGSLEILFILDDENDQSPVFTSKLYSFTVQENSPIGSMIGAVIATDSDTNPAFKQILFSIEGRNEGFFEINQNSGIISTNKTLDYEDLPQKNITLQIKASNLNPGRSTTVQVVVNVENVNDMAPIFSAGVYNWTIKERQTEANITVTAEDGDPVPNKNLTYKLLNSAEVSSIFELNTQSGMVSLLRPLLYETVRHYTLEVASEDNGQPNLMGFSSIRVTIENIADDPQFVGVQLEYVVEENQPTGRFIGSLTAMDLDGDNITIHINDTKVLQLSQAERINVTTVRYDLLTQEALDYEEGPVTRAVDVSLSDGRSNVSTILNITVSDVNDNSPNFTQTLYEVSLDENQEDNNTCIVEILATDRDSGGNGNVSIYQIVSGAVNGLFSLCQTHSKQCVCLNQPLDYELTKGYFLRLKATDAGLPPRDGYSAVEIVVKDVNDEAPVFTKPLYTASIPEHQPTDIITVSSEDRDTNSSYPVYQVLSSSYLNDITDFRFQGPQLKIINNNVDRENPSIQKLGYFVLNISVFDGIYYGYSLVNVTVLDINDHSPRFLPDLQTTLARNFEVGLDVFNVSEKVTDEDPSNSGFTFWLSGDTGPFSINSDSGMISLSQPVGTRDVYNLIVNVLDHGLPPIRNQTGITVIINETNHFEPVFDQSEYSFVVVENGTANQVVGKVTAQDKDGIDKEEGILRYHLMSSSPYFTINATTGEIFTIGVLDRETVCSFNFTVEAVDSGSKPRSSQTFVHIDVLDVDDNPLYFRPVSAVHTVASSALNVSLFSASASDLDCLTYCGNISCSLHYSMSPNLTVAQGSMTIEDRTGLVTVNSLSNSTTGMTILLTVNVSNGKEHKSKLFTVYVYAPSELPKVDQKLEINLAENNPDGELLIDINATIGSRPQDECLQYTIPSLLSNEADRFSIGLLTGILTAKPLDFEKGGTREVPVQITAMFDCDATPPQINQQNKTIVVVKVRLSDIDDCAPEFEKSSYKQDLSESSPPGTTVTVVTATDKDTDPVFTNFTYSIDEVGNENKTFAIDNFGQVIVNKPLSILTKEVYNLTLKASGVNNITLVGKSYLVIKVLDANDNDPVFEQSVYHFNVSEDYGSVAHVGRLVGGVKATDADAGSNSALSYSITTLTSGDVFNISQTGNITTAKLLDRETQDRYFIIVTAEDNGTPSRKGTCEVIISILDVDDHLPELSSSYYEGRVPDGSIYDKVVALEPPLAATDADINSCTLYFGLHGKDSELFDVDNRAIYVNVTTDNPLDREVTPVYYLSVFAVDCGGLNSSMANLTIYITDVNDNPPKFNQTIYYFRVTENEGGLKVGHVFAHDPDSVGTLYYFIRDGDDGKFIINMETGEIQITDGIDREEKSEYILTVVVKDGIFNDTTAVNISVTDENDNFPIFEKPRYQLSVLEESDDLIIGSVNASDKDSGRNGQVTYRLLAAENFSINSTSGVIRSLVRLDREIRAEYRLDVLAEDHGSPSHNTTVTVTVTIRDINDNPPVFLLPTNATQLHASILEKSPVDSVIAWPRAEDMDERQTADLTFQLTGPGQEYFKINPSTGLITIEKRIDLSTLFSEGYIKDNSSESFGTLTLRVTVFDEGLPPLNASIPLVIVVERISDLAPQFTNSVYNFSVKENQPPGVVVGTLELYITLLNASIVPQPHFQIVDTRGTDNHFSISEPSLPTQIINDWHYTTDLVTTSEVINYERERELSLIIRAGDGKTPERSAYAVVLITVEDLNDNSPECPTNSLKLSVVEESPVLVLDTVKVVDRDSGVLIYSIQQDGTGGSLEINATSGVLSLGKPLDRELNSNYSFIIQVEDNDEVRRNCSFSGLLTVTDINDNSPVFYEHNQVINSMNVLVPENVKPGTMILEVFANDSDSGLNGNVLYKLLPADNINFFIHPRDGKLFILGSLDYETVTGYNVTVEGYDLGTPHRSSVLLVIVTVTDIEDTVLLQPVYEFYISGVTPIYTAIGTIPTQQQLFFNITGGNDGQVFEIKSNTGDIVLLKTPGVRSTPFNLTVMTTDYNTPPKVQLTSVLIHTQDTVVSVRYLENQEPFQLIIDINTTEELAGQSVFYSFVGVSYPDLFNMSRSTGEIFALQELDREEVAEYTLYIHGQVTPSLSRQKRAFGGDPGDIQLVIQVGDENDNIPTFGLDKLTFGLPRSDSFNYLITTLVALDEDVGDYSAIRYSILEGDGDSLSVDSYSGELRCTRDLSKTLTSQLRVKVNATDNLGQGHSTQVEVIVLVVSDSDRAILVVDQQTSAVKPYVPAIKGNLSAILSYEITVEAVEPHTVHSESGSSLNPLMSDIYIHALDPATGQIVSHDDLLRRLAEKDSEINDFFSRFNIKELRPLTVNHEAYSMSTAEIALLCLAAVIFAGSILAMGVVVYTSKKYDMESLRNQQAENARAKATEITPNPIYTNNNGQLDSTEPLQQDVEHFINGDVGVYDDNTETSYLGHNGVSTRVLSDEMKTIPIFESQELTMDLFSETTSDYDDIEVAESTLSSEGPTPVSLQEALPDYFLDKQPTDSGNVTEVEIHSDKDSDSTLYPAQPSVSTAATNPAFVHDETPADPSAKPNAQKDETNPASSNPALSSKSGSKSTLSYKDNMGMPVYVNQAFNPDVDLSAHLGSIRGTKVVYGDSEKDLPVPPHGLVSGDKDAPETNPMKPEDSNLEVKRFSSGHQVNPASIDVITRL